MKRIIEGKRVFLSGPMSGIEHYNIAEFAKAHAAVHELGASEVYNPAFAWLNTPLERARDIPHERWMLKCVYELTRPAYGAKEGPYYDLLVSLPGWKRSDGAAWERATAEQCGIVCVDLDDVLRELS